MSALKMVVFDWAGTTIDFGSCAPVTAFVDVFRQHGVTVTPRQARGPMGLNKRTHVQRMLEVAEIGAAWKAVHGRDWTDADVDRLYHDVAPLQLAAIDKHAALVPGLLPTVATLRATGLKIGGTTGYFAAAAARVSELAKEQGFVPETTIHGDEVREGRPAPWMIYEAMQRLNVYPASSVLKVGDTKLDIEEGRNAGTWSIGVCDSSSETGCTVEEWTALSEGDKVAALKRTRKVFDAAGAHDTIATIADLPAAVERINARIATGERP